MDRPFLSGLLIIVHCTGRAKAPRQAWRGDDYMAMSDLGGGTIMLRCVHRSVDRERSQLLW